MTHRLNITFDSLIDTSVNKTIRYTSGIDSEELQILCIPPDDNSGLENIRWTNGWTTFPNPFTLERVITELNTTGNINFTCDDTTNDEMYSTIDIIIQGKIGYWKVMKFFNYLNTLSHFLYLCFTF